MRVEATLITEPQSKSSSKDGHVSADGGAAHTTKPVPVPRGASCAQLVRARAHGGDKRAPGSADDTQPQQLARLSLLPMGVGAMRSAEISWQTVVPFDSHPILEMSDDAKFDWVWGITAGMVGRFPTDVGQRSGDRQQQAGGAPPPHAAPSAASAASEHGLGASSPAVEAGGVAGGAAGDTSGSTAGGIVAEGAVSTAAGGATGVAARGTAGGEEMERATGGMGSARAGSEQDEQGGGHFSNQFSLSRMYRLNGQVSAWLSQAKATRS